MFFFFYADSLPKILKLLKALRINRIVKKQGGMLMKKQGDILMEKQGEGGKHEETEETCNQFDKFSGKIGVLDAGLYNVYLYNVFI